MNFSLGSLQTKNHANQWTKIDNQTTYELLIVGGGPAGCSAAMYAARKNIHLALITKEFGGQLADTSSVENYLGFEEISGLDLAQKFENHLKKHKIAVENGATVTSIIKQNKVFSVVFENELGEKSSLQTQNILLATGCHYRHLGIPGEDKFIGKGIAFCATCDAPLYGNKKAVVVGGGNSGVEAAIELAKIATEVTLIELQKNLIADTILVDKLKQYSNVKILTQHKTLEILGEEIFSGIKIQNMVSGEIFDILCDGMFIQIGMIPNSNLKIENKFDLNQQNEIIIDNEGKTNIEGIFAAGDVTNIKKKQIIIACSEGAKVALAVNDKINKGELNDK